MGLAALTIAEQTGADDRLRRYVRAPTAQTQHYSIIFEGEISMIFRGNDA
jgi:hypothetical protein